MSNKNGPFYVIVGIGYSAVLDHLLLRTTSFGKKRLGNLSILHIGLSDPWADYEIDSMGQWPCLLSLPAFSERHDKEKPRQFLSPASFAAATARELTRLEKEFPCDSTRWGRVGKVSVIGGRFNVAYRDANGEPCSVVAEKMDCCTGPNPPSRLKKCQLRSNELAAEYFDGTPAAGISRLLTGEEFLRREIEIPKGVICVAGGGGTAAWCVERALRKAERVVWVCRDVSQDTFPPSKRNDQLVRGVSRDGMKFVPEQGLIPAHPRLRLAVGYQIRNLDVNGRGKVEIQFEEYPKSSIHTYVDATGHSCGKLECETYDQTVTAFGQFKTVPAYLRDGDLEIVSLEPITRYKAGAARKEAKNPVICFADNRDQEKSRLRILGTAARSFPDDSHLTFAKLEMYQEELAKQAYGSQIPTGALAIARANEFFSENNPNRNINTLDDGDFQAMETDLSISQRFLDERKERAEPFNEIPQELQKANLDWRY